MEINAKLLNSLANFSENAIFENDNYTNLLYELLIAAQWGNQSTSFCVGETMYKTVLFYEDKLRDLGFHITQKDNFGFKNLSVSWENAR